MCIRRYELDGAWNHFSPRILCPAVAVFNVINNCFLQTLLIVTFRKHFSSDGNVAKYSKQIFNILAA